jgi:hypothetical protein
MTCTTAPMASDPQSDDWAPRTTSTRSISSALMRPKSKPPPLAFTAHTVDEHEL